jgi:hypothetical protein
MRQIDSFFVDTVIPVTITSVEVADGKINEKDVLLTAQECKNCHRVFAVEEDYLEAEAGICACPCCGSPQIVNEPENEEVNKLLVGE